MISHPHPPPSDRWHVRFSLLFFNFTCGSARHRELFQSWAKKGAKEATGRIGGNDFAFNSLACAPRTHVPRPQKHDPHGNQKTHSHYRTQAGQTLRIHVHLRNQLASTPLYIILHHHHHHHHHHHRRHRTLPSSSPFGSR